MLLEKTSLGSKLLVGAGLAAFLVICERSLTQEPQLDFFIYRAGSQLALDGKLPYWTPLIQARAAEQFPDDKTGFAANSGYFLPPQAIVVFLPFAKMDWGQAQLVWFILLSTMGFICGLLAYSFGRSQERLGIGWPFIVLIVWMNPITISSLMIGQTTLLFVGCLVLGQYAFENDSPRLGTFLWSITFIKPHLALPFLVLAWVLGGWKRATGIIVVVALWNLFGGLIVTGTLEGSYDLFRFYLEYLRIGHNAGAFNLAAETFQIPSWNRIIAASGGPAIDLNIWMTLTGFAIWGLLVTGRLWLAGALGQVRCDPAYLVAVTAVGALFFAQVLAYEMVLLALLAPLILQHFDAGRKGDALALIAMLLFMMLPMNLTDQLADRFGWPEETRQRTLIRSHKCFGMAALALYLLIRGPIRTTAAAGESKTRPVEALG